LLPEGITFAAPSADTTQKRKSLDSRRASRRASSASQGSEKQDAWHEEDKWNGEWNDDDDDDWQEQDATPKSLKTKSGKSAGKDDKSPRDPKDAFTVVAPVGEEHLGFKVDYDSDPVIVTKVSRGKWAEQHEVQVGFPLLRIGKKETGKLSKEKMKKLLEGKRPLELTFRKKVKTAKSKSKAKAEESWLPTFGLG